MAGVYLQVSYFVSFILMIPVTILWCFTGPFLRYLGYDYYLSELAHYYSTVLVFALPARLIFRQLDGYYQCQRILRPMVISSLLGIFLNIILSVPLVLGYKSFPGYGFEICPIITLVVEWTMVAYFLISSVVIQKHHEKCWPKNGWAMENITKERVIVYLRMVVPQMIMLTSETWKFLALGAICAHFGAVELEVFNASYRIIWICMYLI